LQHIAEMSTNGKLLSTFLGVQFSICHYAVNWCDKLWHFYRYVLHYILLFYCRFRV